MKTSSLVMVALAAVVLFAAQCASLADSSGPRVIIVGAGMAGISARKQLREPIPAVVHQTHPPPRTISGAAEMYPSDLIGGLDRLRQQAARAAASTVSLAKPAAGAAVAGLASTISLAKPAAGAAVSGLVSTASLAKPVAGAAVSGLVSTASLAKPVAGAAVSGLATTASLAKPVAGAAVSGLSTTVSLAQPVAGAAVSGVSSTLSLAQPVAGAAVSGLASTVSLVAKPVAGAAVSGLGSVTRHAAGMVFTREGAVKTAAVVVGGAVGAYFLWPAAATAAAGTMNAPGAAGFVISRAAFVANPQLYFQILRTAGAAAAAAAFAV